MKKLTISRKTFAFPYLAFLLLFVVFPLLLLVFYSFTTKVDGVLVFTLQNFVKFFTNSTFNKVFLDSMLVGLATTLICLAIAYPLAYFLADKKINKSATLVMLFVLPMWVNFLLRSLAAKEMLLLFGSEMGMGSVIFGMSYNFLPFMILPLHNTLSRMDKNLLEASSDLGAKPFQVFLKTVVPLSIPGIVSGVTMVFMPSISAYVISDMFSNGKIKLFGNILVTYTNSSNGLGMASALSLIMFLIIVLPMFFTRKYENVGMSEGGTLW